MSYQDDRWEERLEKATNAEREHARQIEKHVNVMYDPAVVGALLARYAHKTLQQGFASLAVGFIEEMARLHAEDYVDLRNEASAEFCALIAETFKDEVPFQFKTGSRFPFI